MLVLLSPPKTDLEEQDIWIGNTSAKLTEASIEEAKAFFKHNMWIAADRAFVAPSDHMQEFAEIVVPIAKPVVVEEFADRSMGVLTGRPYRETMNEFPRRNWLAWQRSYWSAPPKGESLFDISDRVITAFRSKVLPIPPAETVLIVCAPDVMRILLGFITHTEETDVPKLKIEPLIPYVVNGDIWAS